MRIVAVKQPLSTEQATGLAGLLIACIDDGAVDGYLSGTRADSAAASWGSTIKAACDGRTALLMALDQDEAVVGTVQVAVRFPPDQAQVAGIQMLLVHPRSRRRAIGRHLMQAAEGLCQRMGRQVIILQTAGGPAGLVHASLGFAVCGIIPDLFRETGRCPGGRLAVPQADLTRSPFRSKPVPITAPRPSRQDRADLPTRSDRAGQDRDVALRTPTIPPPPVRPAMRRVAVRERRRNGRRCGALSRAFARPAPRRWERDARRPGRG